MAYAHKYLVLFFFLLPLQRIICGQIDAIVQWSTEGRVYIAKVFKAHFFRLLRTLSVIVSVMNM